MTAVTTAAAARPAPIAVRNDLPNRRETRSRPPGLQSLRTLAGERQSTTQLRRICRREGAALLSPLGDDADVRYTREEPKRHDGDQQPTKPDEEVPLISYDPGAFQATAVDVSQRPLKRSGSVRSGEQADPTGAEAS